MLEHPIWRDAPREEPRRQLYFIGKCREWAQAFCAEKGHAPTAYVCNMGCQMNARDSEKLAGILSEAGFAMADGEQADFVIYNTCTVRENANRKVYGRLGLLKHEKQKNPDMLIALCGCMMQEPDVVKKIQTDYGFVDLVFGTHNLYKFAELLMERLVGGKLVADLWEQEGGIVEHLPARRKYPFKSGVNIMYGCDNFCSYCIVPYVRGRERSRDAADILEEVRRLAADGAVEVMLLGQNVNSYGRGLEKPLSFAALLREVEQVAGIRRIRFMTSHPKDLSEELIDTMANSEKICHHLHLPLQSGSSRVLRLMNRHYTKESYLDLVGRLRDRMPDLAVTTDIIVGFPQETEADFQETLDVVRQARFESAFTFQYSRRTGTPAASMEGQVAPDVTKERFGRLLALVQKTASEKMMAMQGAVQPVLVEEVNHQDAGLVTGRLSQNMVVHFPGDASLVGQIVPVRLVTCKGFYFLGERVDAQASAEGA